MKKLFYTALISAGAVVAVMVVLGLYRSGSTSVPSWPRLFQPGALSAKHAFLADKCETCHTPVRGIEATTCIACHVTAAADLAKQSTAFHADAQDCRGCHAEHLGAARPIKMDHAALLRIGSHMAVGSAGHPTVPRQMVEDLAAFLEIRLSQPTERKELACSNCHSNRDPHRTLLGSDCAGCHETTTWRVAGFLHPSPTSRDCSQCHQAPPSHYMEHFEMVSKSVARQEHANVNECYLCHRTDAFNDIKGIGWYKHH